MDLARRSLRSVSWNLGATAARFLILFVRSVLLARWLPVAVFGVYGMAGVVVSLSLVLAEFGLDAALLHRHEDNRDEAASAATHFTLRTLILAGWFALLLSGTALFADGELREALVVLAVFVGGQHLTSTAKYLLIRRVEHSRLAVLNITSAVLTTAVALALAARGEWLWALLSTDVVAFLVYAVGLYVWRPVWRPRFTWRPAVVSYFLGFGRRQIGADLLEQSLGRVDQLVTGWMLGDVALGHYRRAQVFAAYPSQFLAAPVNHVVGGSYAELHGDRVRLSRAFQRTNMAMLRASFLVGGALALAAPELIRIVLGPKWLPMLPAFRLLLLFTLLAPLRRTVADLFVAVGEPQRVIWARGVQLAVLLAGLAALAPTYGITGVAVAVSAMLTIGLAVLLFQARRHVDFSIWRIFGIPTIALVTAGILSRFSIDVPGVRDSYWLMSIVKLTVFVSVYLFLLVLHEKREFREAFALAMHSLGRRTGKPVPPIRSDRDTAPRATGTTPRATRFRRRPLGISVLVACQNEEAVIDASVRSFLEFADEVIVVDNGSTDASPDLLADLARRHRGHVFVHHEPDLVHLNEVRQVALLRSRFAWVVRADGDFVAYTDGPLSILPLRDELLRDPSRIPRVYAAWGPTVNGDFRHTGTPRERPGPNDPGRFVSPAVSAPTLRIYKTFPGFAFCNIGRWEATTYHRLLRALRIDLPGPPWMHCNLKSDATYLLRAVRTNWSEHGDFARFPTVESYLQHVMVERFGTDDFDEAAAVYMEREFLPFLEPYDTEVHPPYPSLVREQMERATVYRIVEEDGRLRRTYTPRSDPSDDGGVA